MIQMDPLFMNGGFVPFAPYEQPGSGMRLQPIADPNVQRPRSPIGDLVRNKNPIGGLLNPQQPQPGQMPSFGGGLLDMEMTPSTPSVGIGQMGVGAPQTSSEMANWDPNWNEPFGKTLTDLAMGSVPVTMGRGIMSEVSGGRMTPPPTYQGFVNMAMDSGRGGGLFGPASFTVGKGQQGPQMPAAPIAPVEMSLLGDPGAGGYSGYSGGGYSGFDGVDIGSLSDMGYSGGFGIGW